MELDVTVNHDTVFLQTSLDTHLVMMVYRGETVMDFKKRVSQEHRVSFPRLGDIEVEALKVKFRGQLFTLSDSLFVKSAFVGNSKKGLLYVDASSMKGHGETTDPDNVVDCGGIIRNSLLLDGPSKRCSVAEISLAPDNLMNLHPRQKISDSEEVPEVTPRPDSPGKVFSNIKVVSGTDEKEKLILPRKDEEGKEMKIGDQEVDRKNDVSTKIASKKRKSRKTIELVVSDPSLKENGVSPSHNTESCYEVVAQENNLGDKSTVTGDHSTGGPKAVISDHSSFNAEKEEKYVPPMGTLKVSNVNNVITSNLSTEIDIDDAVRSAKASKSEADTEATGKKSKKKRKRNPESYPRNQEEVQTNNNNIDCEGAADRKIADVLLNLESQFNGSNLEGESDGVAHEATLQNGTSNVHSVSTKDQDEIIASSEAIVHKKPNAKGAAEFTAKGTKDKVETRSSVSRITAMDTAYVSIPNDFDIENRDEKSRKKRKKKQEPYPQNVEDDQNTNSIILSKVVHASTVAKNAATLSNLENNDVGNVSTQDQHAIVASSEVVIPKLPMAKATNELNAKDSKNKGQMQSLVSETTDIMDTDDVALGMVEHMPKVSKNEVKTGEKSRKKKKKKEESCPQNLEVQTVGDKTVHEGEDTTKVAKDLLNFESQLIGSNDLKAKKTNNKVDKQSFSPSPCSGSSLELHGMQLETRACNSGSTHQESSLKSVSDKVPLQKKRKSQNTPVLNNQQVLQPEKRDERNSLLEEAKKPADSDASKTKNEAVKKGPATTVVLRSSLTPSRSDGKINPSVGHHRGTGKTVSANIQTVNSFEQKKSLLGSTGSIFKDDTDESSEDESSDNDSDFTPSHSPLLPDLSDGESDDDKKNSQPTGQKKSDGETNKSELSSQKNICLDEMLKNSITYKKVAASRSLLEDSESQVEFVPDSQAM